MSFKVNPSQSVILLCGDSTGSTFPKERHEIVSDSSTSCSRARAPPHPGPSLTLQAHRVLVPPGHAGLVAGPWAAAHHGSVSLRRGQMMLTANHVLHPMDGD